MTKEKPGMTGEKAEMTGWRRIRSCGPREARGPLDTLLWDGEASIIGIGA